MQKRKRGAPLPKAGLKAQGHRSTVGGTQRLFSGRKKSAIQDTLHLNAKHIMRRLIAPQGPR